MGRTYSSNVFSLEKRKKNTTPRRWPIKGVHTKQQNGASQTSGMTLILPG